MNWSNDLQDARTDDDVLDVVNGFLASQDAQFWSHVPESARPEDLDAPNDIHHWHHELVNHLKVSKPASMPLQELCVLFLRASVRLHQIDVANPGAPSNDELDCAARPSKPKLRC